MPAVTLSPVGNGFQFFTASGLPLSGGLLNTYIAGTTTPLATYTDSAGTITNANPIVLGPDGRPPGEIWLLTSSGYKFVLTDSLASPVGPSLDNLTGIANLNNATLTGNTVIGTTGNTLNVANGALVVSSGNTAVGGDLSVAGNTTLGNAGADIVTINAATLALVNSPAISGAATWTGVQTFSANPAGRILSSTYTPTSFNTTNITSSTPDVAIYTRVGDMVTVAGNLLIDPTTASIASTVGLSIPIASNFTGTGSEVGGVAFTGSVFGLGGQISADPANDRVLITFIADAGAASHLWGYIYMYQVK